MLNPKVYIPTILLVLFFSCRNQKQEKENSSKYNKPHYVHYDFDSSLYLGRVIGKSPEQFIKENTSEVDSSFSLPPIINSNHLLEIRFYPTLSWSDTVYCTILTWDSLFTIRRVGHKNDTSKNNFDIPINYNADSIFSKLIENGVFSLTESNNISEYFKEIKSLTKKGLKGATHIGDVADGAVFRLQYKVDTIYNSVHMTSPWSYFEHNPDNQLYRRNYEIARILLK
ncbi:hypothetical protein [Ferruginibacter sp. SUN106]|uniref:hypothetical protein n=1 Tax=Ferruginibacter sp. SUN106 TaxID=2978348 RepID=UPI003D35CDA7